MARRPRGGKLETRSARLKLEVRRKSYTVRLAPGVRLGYRRNRAEGAWSVIVADGQGSAWIRKIGAADDHAEADGNRILTFWQAQELALKIARGGRGEDSGGRPVTVSEALSSYQNELRAHGGDPANASRVRFHLTPHLASLTVGLLRKGDLISWRDGLLNQGLAPASVRRTMRALVAALNFAADSDPRITNREAWTRLRSLPDAEGGVRNVVLSPEQVRKLVDVAYAIDPAVGLWIETMATTGARPSQLRRLLVGDLQAEQMRLQMPSSRKGRRKQIRRAPVPIPARLVAALEQSARSRPPDAPLLLRPDGTPLGRRDHSDWFAQAAAAAGVDPGVTAYSLRHTSITRCLLKGLPIRLTAVLHDTSAIMIERNYSKYIASHGDELLRGALLDLGEREPSEASAAGLVPASDCETSDS